MGIKDFSDFQERAGVSAFTLEIPPGKRTAIDAMILLCQSVEACGKSHITEIIGNAGANGSPKMRVEDAKRILTSHYEHADYRDSLDGEKFANYDCFLKDMQRAPAGADAALPPYIDIRKKTVVKMVSTLADYLSSGCLPVLVWDGTIIGGERTAHKKRKPSISLIRSIDRVYIFEVLRQMGFPTVVGWTEGEKVCCAAAQSGAVDIVMTVDTDAHVLGAPAIIENAFPNRSVNGGMTAPKAFNRSELANKLGAITGRERKLSDILIDVALFLGCDFVDRLRGNGPAKAIKTIANIPANTSFAWQLYQNARTNEEVAKIVTPEEVVAAREFYIVTDEDRARAAELVNLAIENAGVLNEDALARLDIYAETMQMYGRIVEGIRTFQEKREEHGSRPLVWYPKA